MKQKTDLKTYLKDKRNWYHALIGLTIGFDVIMIIGFYNREKFPLSWDDLRTLLAPGVGAVISWLIAFYGEKKQDEVTENSSDMRDVWFTTIFAFIAGEVAIFYPSWYAAIALTIISVIVFITQYKK